MANTPKVVTIDIRTIPTVREALAAAWDEGEDAGFDLATGGPQAPNPYRSEPAEGSEPTA